jgi:NADH-quinone oxidoreductase subunit L
VGGLVNTPFRTTLEHFLEPAFEMVSMQHPPEGWLMFILLAGLSVVAALAGLGAAVFTYNRPDDEWRPIERGLEPLWGTWAEAYHVDEIYGRALVAPGLRIAGAAAFAVDLSLIDGAVNGLARMVRRVGDWARPLQTGFVRNYALLFLFGTVFVVIWLVAGGS